MLTGLWMWVLVALDAFADAVCAVLWWVTWPVRALTARHHTKVADEFDRQAAQAASTGQHEAAAELAGCARERRRQARRLR